MCRISGAYDPNKEQREKNVAAMVAFQHRGGPDDKGIFNNLYVSFGHNRLSIIGEQKQPIESGRYWLTFNGEIYNYKELMFNPESDTATLLASINAFGVKETLNDLNGMFAFAVHDKQEQKIHLAVDRFAQKPIYYYHDEDTNRFYFASWPAALYDLEPSWEIDKEALQSYWLLGSVMGEDSIFKGIKKLNASEHLTYSIRENKITIERYWEPQFQENTNGIEDLVLDAINLTKVSDVPIHIFLSGGIDSTLVASQFKGGQAIHLDGPETEYARQVARKFEIDLKVCTPEQIQTEAYLLDYSRQTGEPTMAGLIPYTTAKEVSKYGKVAISANGADELFFGYDRTHEYLTEKQLRHTYRDIPLPKFKDDWHEYSYPFHVKFNGKKDGRIWELGGYVQFDLNKTLDFASMCHGIEVRNPFLDHRLVEMALSIPESVHRKQGNKTILKNMLAKMGFDKLFLNRTKQGFSLFRKPENIDQHIATAWRWCHDNGFLNVEHLPLSGRDQKYLEMSALGFYYWFKAWEHKIK
jgi:asparagine synthase (glutamine-hydrolysing)